MMDEREITIIQVEKAKAFWGNVDVDRVFDELLQHLVQLRESIKTNTASDKEYLQGFNIIQDCGINETLTMKHFAIEAVVIGEDYLKSSDLGCLRPLEDMVPEQDMSYDDSQELEPPNYHTPVILNPRDPLTPLSPHQDMFDLVLLSPPPYSLENTLGHIYSPQPDFEPHDCSPACVDHLPPHPDHFLGQNPLRAPLLCRFRRHCSGKAQYSAPDDADADESAQMTDEDGEDGEVVYRAPCGRELSCVAEVLLYLRQTESLGVLQPWNFSFHPEVNPELPPVTLATTLCKRDLSRGIESVAVQLCNDVDSAPLAEFRYRRERWPHGCFLSTGELFSACCDCTDGCIDSSSCACLQLAQKGAGGAVQYYMHQRLQEPVPTGLYECSPWCGCDPFRCLNRVVQHGVRVRLQVFRRKDHCWGVRCRDDLDVGTFVCTYAGVVLRTEQSAEEPPAPKSAREEPLSDDEVEVVEEWTLPAQPLPGSSAAATDPCSPSHIPVIQRPSDHSAPATNGDKDNVRREDQENLPPVGKVAEEKMETEEDKRLPGEKEIGRDDPKLRTSRQGDVRKYNCSKQQYFLDATKEGNVGRFINRSRSPNLFVQSVFVDTHDPQYPIMAFFTSRAIKAGSELTWHCNHDNSGD